VFVLVDQAAEEIAASGLPKSRARPLSVHSRRAEREAVVDTSLANA
jgi:hypothetical protein